MTLMRLLQVTITLVVVDNPARRPFRAVRLRVPSQIICRLPAGSTASRVLSFAGYPRPRQIAPPLPANHMLTKAVVWWLWVPFRDNFVIVRLVCLARRKSLHP